MGDPPVTSVPRSLLAIDAGAATTSVALVGRIGDRWRLLGSLAGPSPTDPEALAATLAARIRDTDPSLAAAIQLDPRTVGQLPRLEARSVPPMTLAVLAGSRRTVGLLASAAERTSWRVVTASPESHDPREMTDLALRPEVAAILVGTSEPPGPDERSAIDDIAALAGAVARRRPELRIVFAGPIASRRAWREALGETAGPPALATAADGKAGDEAATEPETPSPAADVPSEAPRFFQAPALGPRSAPDEPLRDILEGLAANTSDTRHIALRTLVSLADVLDRRIELLEIGLDGGLRGIAQPGVADEGPSVEGVRCAAAGLVPPDPDEDIVEGVLAWTTGSLDRHRMADRLRDLRSLPWADASGDGARLRLAAARAALARLVEATPDLSARPPADLTLVAGGAFALPPGGSVVLAVADVVRRTGVTQVAHDHARLLGPLGTIDDPDERRELVADLADDLLAPLGSLLVAAGMPSRLRGRAATGTIELAEPGDGASPLIRRELTTGELARIELAPGSQLVASIEFRDSARIGRRARRFSVPVAGGLAGVLVDLRDVPLRLPDRRDRRRAALATWSDQVWPEDDR